MRVSALFSICDMEFDGTKYNAVTPGRSYFVWGISSDRYRIVNDDGDPVLYAKAGFGVDDPSIPEGWMFIEYDEGEYFLDPCEAVAPGFYEDFFGSDGDRERQEAARQAVLSFMNRAFGTARRDEDERDISEAIERLLVAIAKRDARSSRP